MTTEATERPYHHGNLREAVLEAALDVLRRKEPAEVSLRELARTVGVRHSALYVHFRDRSALLAAIAGQGFQALLAAMQATDAPEDTRLASLAATYVTFARTNPAHYRTMFLPEVSSPENYGQIRIACEACFGTLTDALQHFGEGTAEAIHDRAVAIWSTLHGLALLGGDAGPLSSQIAAGQEIVLASQIVTILAGSPWPAA